MTTGVDFKLTDASSNTVENIPCDQCQCFTVDYKFHTGAPIPLDDRLAHRLSYTNEDRYFFKLPWLRKDVWPDLPGLQASFLAGCALCGALRTKLSAEKYQQRDPAALTSEITIKAEFGFQVPTQRKPTGVVFECQFAGQSQWHRTAQQPTFLLAAPGGSPASRQFTRLRASEPLSLDNQTFMKEWIKQCGEEHRYCKAQTSQPLPTRLIDVEPQNPRLVLTNGKNGIYATLSYCWGLSPDNPYESFYTTTKATKEARMGGMPFEEMPKTLQDAVLVTRALGLKYLWIDALCIIQDSKSDVEHEIKSMVSVYGNCEIVICATSAANSKAGFLSTRDLLQPIVTMPFIPSDGGDGETYGFYDTATFPTRNNWRSIENSEWNKRAWTFQERVVSPRVLHFGNDTMYLECRTSDFSELGCSPRRLIVGNSVLGNDYRYLGVSQFFSSQSSLDIAEVYETYYKFASKYSERLLSFEADRESAFSAVVAQFAHDLTSSEHVYGLWVNDLWRGLVWSVRGRRGDFSPEDRTISRRKESESTWPSWSWYSCPDAISWIHSSKIWKSISPQSLLPQGSNSPKLISITSSLPSRLVISAVLRDIEIKITTGPNAEIVFEGERWGNADLDAKFDFDDEVRAESEKLPLKRIWLLQLRNKFQIYDDAGNITMCLAAGLILEPAGSRDCYRRIGIFSIDSRAKWETLFEGQEQTQITLI